MNQARPASIVGAFIAMLLGILLGVQADTVMTYAASLIAFVVGGGLAIWTWPDGVGAIVLSRFRSTVTLLADRERRLTQLAARVAVAGGVVAGLVALSGYNSDGFFVAIAVPLLMSLAAALVIIGFGAMAGFCAIALRQRRQDNIRAFDND